MRRLATTLGTVFAFYAFLVPAASAEGPSRSGLALRVAPVEAMAPALLAEPDALEALEAYNLAGNVPTQNGFPRVLVNAREVRLSAADLLRPTPFPLSGGVVTRSEHALVWSGEVRVADAHALRLHFASVALPPGTRVWAYAPGGDQAEVPLALFRSAGELWTSPFWGDSLWLEVAVPAAALGPGREARFTLDRVLELVELDGKGRPVLRSAVAEKETECFVTVPCAKQTFPGAIAEITDAVARIFFVRDGGGFICSGGLIEDTDPNTVRALFLTANHCIHNATVAATAATFFRLLNKSCTDQDLDPNWERIDGATFLATREGTDGTLIELAGLPPNPDFLPFDADPAASAPGVIVNDISLPGGFFQVFSRHRIVAECINDGNFFSSSSLFGGIGPGSSGSLAVNTEGKVIGQLRGLCGTGGVGGICTNPQVYAFFGRMSTQFGDFSAFLDPPDAGFFHSTIFPDFAFKVEITAGGESRIGKREGVCLPETECVSGALEGRTEVLLRIIGPRPNGKLWPTLVKFTTSRVDVWIRQLSTGVEKHYVLEGAAPGVDELPGLFDRDGFDP